MQRNDKVLLGLLYLVSCIGQASIIIINLALVFFARNTLRLDPAYIGFFAAAANVTYCFGLIVLKDFSASLKPLHTSLIASSAMALIPLLITLNQGVTAAFLLYGLYGLFMSLFWPPIMGWISRGREKKELGRRMGQFNVAWSIGVLTGPYLAGLLSELNPVYGLYAAGASAFTVVMIMAVSSRLIPEISKAESRKTLNSLKTQVDASTPLRYLTWAGLFTGYVIFGITMNIFPLYAQDVLQYPEGRIGMLLLFRGVSTTGCFYLLAKSHYWHHNPKAIFGFQMLAVLTCLFGMGASSFLSLTVFMLVFGICFSHLYMFAIFHGASGSINRERRMAIHETVITLGVFLGSAAGGMLYSRWGFFASMAAAAGVGTAGLVFQLSCMGMQRRCRFQGKSL